MSGLISFSLRTKLVLYSVVLILVTTISGMIAAAVLNFTQTRHSNQDRLQNALLSFQTDFHALLQNTEARFQTFTADPIRTSRFATAILFDPESQEQPVEIGDLSRQLNAEQAAFYFKTGQETQNTLKYYYSRSLGGIVVPPGIANCYTNTEEHCLILRDADLFRTEKRVPDQQLFPSTYPAKTQKHSLQIKRGQLLLISHLEYLNTSFEDVTIDVTKGMYIGTYLLEKTLDVPLEELDRRMGVKFNLYDVQGQPGEGQVSMPALNLEASPHFSNEEVQELVDLRREHYDALLQPLIYEGETIGYVSVAISQTETVRKIRETVLVLFLICMAILGATIACSLWLVRQFTEPVLKLAKFCADIAQGTGLLKHVPLSRLEARQSDRDEVKALEASFNAMINKVILGEERMVSLRNFANNIANFKEPSQTLEFALRELCQHMHVTQAFLFYDLRGERFEECLPYYTYTADEIWNFFQTSVPPSLVETLLNEAESEIYWSNYSPSTHPLIAFYQPFVTSHDLQGSHFIVIQVTGLPPHWLLLFRKPGSPPFDHAGLEYAQSMVGEIRIAHRNIAAIRESARMEGELRTAAAVQQALFPKALPQVGNLELASFFQSASETGGDWYGFMIHLQKSLFIMIGDVTGHGTPAALVTATASATCRTLEDVYTSTAQVPTPATFLAHLNTAIFNTGYPNFLMTFFIAQIDLETGRMTFANAGHNFPLLVHADGDVKHLLNVGPRLGYQAEYQFQESQCFLQKGDLLLFYTDGLVENMNPAGEMWGERKLLRYLKKHGQLSAKQLLNRLVQDTHNFYNGQPLEDDMTIVLCQVTENFPQAPST